MLKIRCALLVMIMIVLWAIQALAQSPPSGRWWRSPTVIKALNLTQSEIQQLEDAFENSRRKMIDQKSKVEREQFELSRMMEKRNLDENTIRAQNRKLEKARSDLADAKFAFVIDVRRIIGAGRFQRLLELKP
jgi:Spy/CpxP family protein refolding chaperone